MVGLRRFALGICCALHSVLGNAASTAGELEPKPAELATKPSMLRGDDGKIDVSNFLDQAYGFLPAIVPITEPAVGAGAAAALAFIDRPREGSGFNRPNISVIGGLGTENGTEGYFGSDMRYCRLHCHRVVA